jgi:hypothetical protein
MSLYSDNAPDQDPYQALTVALGKPAESKEQVEALLVVSDLLDKRFEAMGVEQYCLWIGTKQFVDGSQDD